MTSTQMKVGDTIHMVSTSRPGLKGKLFRWITKHTGWTPPPELTKQVVTSVNSGDER